MSSRAILCMLAFMIATTGRVNAFDRTYDGFCEASAVVRIDETRMIVASDDFPRLMAFERGKPEGRVVLDLGQPGLPETTDIEAAARIGDVIIWLTSHSLTSPQSGAPKDKDKRKLLFATRPGAEGMLEPVGTPYRLLRRDLAAALKMTEADLKANLNIEGMADTPDGNLLIGLRGPRNGAQSRAILVEITNPLALFGLSGTAGEAADVKPPVLLDLSDGEGLPGRGIRDMVRIGSDFLLIAGAEPDGAEPAPKLFRWDGHSPSANALDPQPDLSGMMPEAIIAWGPAEAEILGDNGGAIINGAPCKDGDEALPGAHFPAVDVKL